MAGDIAKLFPYRDTNGRLMFRGKVGCADSGVSIFHPYKDTAGKMMLRGMGPDGCILNGYPYIDSNGLLKGRTRCGGGPPSFPLPASLTCSTLINWAIRNDHKYWSDGYVVETVGGTSALATSWNGPATHCTGGRGLTPWGTIANGTILELSDHVCSNSPCQIYSTCTVPYPGYVCQWQGLDHGNQVREYGALPWMGYEPPADPPCLFDLTPDPTYWTYVAGPQYVGAYYSGLGNYWSFNWAWVYGYKYPYATISLKIGDIVDEVRTVRWSITVDAIPAVKLACWRGGGPMSTQFCENLYCNSEDSDPSPSAPVTFQSDYLPYYYSPADVPLWTPSTTNDGYQPTGITVVAA